jgi:dihydrofolate synthase/folylpolyglutamate synthase
MKKEMKTKTLAEWLDYIGGSTPGSMKLGLERVQEVAGRMNLLQPKCPVIIVAGTNGKGSCVAGLEAIYLAAGYKVGAFTSPFLFRHNELVRLQGKAVEDAVFCQAYAQIDAARQNISLTQFEFNTLAALFIFQQSALDVWVLEVGLGGRLDAVNIMDADVALVASIAIDHAEWLGDTRELIGYEKAGIFRSEHPVVCGDSEPPTSLLAQAVKIKAPILCQGKDFHYKSDEKGWMWQSAKNQYQFPFMPLLALQNMSTVLMAVELMQAKLPVLPTAIDQALRNVTLPGRIQILFGDITLIMDVSHNPAAAQFLAARLQQMSCLGKCRAVFSMLADKDILGTLQAMQPIIDEWYIAPLSAQRGATLTQLKNAFQQASIVSLTSYDEISLAYDAARQASQPGDWIIVFGSFYTVAGVNLMRSQVSPI